MTLLDVSNLTIQYPGDDPAVRGLSFAIEAGEALGLVGESGSGKTQTALAIMGLLPANASVDGSISFDKQELLGANPTTLNQYRACRIAMVFQDPRLALNPYVRIGDQIKVTVLEVRAGQVKLGIDAPTEVKVHREEVYTRIQAENRRAGKADPSSVRGTARQLRSQRPASRGPGDNTPA